MHAELSLSLGTLYSFLFVLARLSGAFVFVPLPGVRSGPEPARVVLAVSLSLALSPFWPEVRQAPGIGLLALWMLSELGFGVTIGVAVAFLTEALQVATQVIGLQAGYSYASTIDPTTEADSNVLQVFSQLWAGLLFFTFGLDRQVVRVFARSLETFPPGAYAPSISSSDALLRLGSEMFSTGLRLAMPVIALLMLVDVSLALFGRMHSQLQLLTLAFPAKMMAALGLLAAVSAVFVPVYRSAAERTFSTVMGLLGGHGG